MPLDLETRAVVSGFPEGIRYFPRDATQLSEFEQDMFESWKREKAYRRSQGHTGPLPPAAYLAISGGGDNGAFGAGLLDGWTKAGTRPEFKLVTGVSTGALDLAVCLSGSGVRRAAEGHVHGGLDEGHRRRGGPSSR